MCPLCHGKIARPSEYEHVSLTKSSTGVSFDFGKPKVSIGSSVIDGDLDHLTEAGISESGISYSPNNIFMSTGEGVSC